MKYYDGGSSSGRLKRCQISIRSNCHPSWDHFKIFHHSNLYIWFQVYASWPFLWICSFQGGVWEKKWPLISSMFPDRLPFQNWSWGRKCLKVLKIAPQTCTNFGHFPPNILVNYKNLKLQRFNKVFHLYTSIQCLDVGRFLYILWESLGIIGVTKLVVSVKLWVFLLYVI